MVTTGKGLQGYLFIHHCTYGKTEAPPDGKGLAQDPGTGLPKSQHPCAPNTLARLQLFLVRPTRGRSAGRCCPRRPYPLHVAPLGGRARQAEPDHVHEQAWDAQQVHGVADKG